MKRIALIIIVLIAQLQTFAQNLNFLPKPDEFSKEFIRLLDSTRAAEFNQSYSTRKDSCASLACKHHNTYLYSLVEGKAKDPLVGGHTEEKILLGNEYTGKDTLLYDFINRCDYYCGKGNFYALGECFWAGYTTYPEYKKMTSEQLARRAFNGFMKSKPHREILITKNYTDVGIDFTIDPDLKRFYITVVVGYNKKAKK